MWGFVSLLDLGSVTALQGADFVGAAVGAFVFVIIVLILLFASLKVVKEYERIVNFRLGKAQAEKGPGIVVVIPGIDKPVRVDLRERYLQIPHQTCITKDNAPVDVDFFVYFKVASAADSVIRVNNFEGAAMGIATTTLRAVIGDIILDEVLSKPSGAGGPSSSKPTGGRPPRSPSRKGTSSPRSSARKAHDKPRS